MIPFLKRRPPFDPVLSFPPEEQAFIRAAYGAATQILEYGSGGSTVLAASLGKPVVSVESDARWAAAMTAYLAARHPGAKAEVVHSDIGPTKSWGRPRNSRGLANYHLYPLAVWDRPDMAPDLVLIDGRFRVACLCAVMLRTRHPVQVIFDDYAGRTEYTLAGLIQPPRARVGRMAVFDVVPAPLPPEHLTAMIGSFVQTR